MILVPSSFLPIHPLGRGSTFLGIMADIDCQLSRLSNYLADKSPGMSGSFQTGLVEVGRSTLAVDSTRIQAEWKEKKKAEH